MSHKSRFYSIFICFIIAFSCTEIPPNSPYIAHELKSNTYFSFFQDSPGNFDPYRAYSNGEFKHISLMCETLLDYHYLKRPYALIPLIAQFIPEPVYYDIHGNPLPKHTDAENVIKTTYTFQIKKNIRYAKHPCFAQHPDGSYIYHGISPDTAYNYREITDFKKTGSRELCADDFIYAFYRLADPRTQCPYITVLKQYIAGFEELHEALTHELKRIRAARKKRIGPFYNQEQNERSDPIHVNRLKFPFEGIQKIDDYSFTITIHGKYPSFIYWLAMPFTAPLPWEAEKYFNQSAMLQQNVTLSKYPVGTGPYRLEKYDSNMELVYSRNVHYNDPIRDFYPTEGMPEDTKLGLLQEAGKPLPFIDQIIFRLEKEPTTRWNKFLQGYYDESSMVESTFDKVMQINYQSGEIASTDFLKSKDISLVSTSMLTVGFYFFNMRDPIWGGLGEKQCNMRQAVQIALDLEEKLKIFNNDLGMVPMSCIPPNMDGFITGKEGINPYIYTWNEKLQRPERKSMETAKELLSKAGYPNGMDEQGNPLVLHYDIGQTQVSSEIQWMQKQLEKINIKLMVRTSEFGQIWERIESGSFQFAGIGWNADYPDPENFLYLYKCENLPHELDDPELDCNWFLYDNPDFNRLYKKIKTMEPGVERNILVQDCVRMLQHDAPVINTHVPYLYTMVHSWLHNKKPGVLGSSALKYLQLDWKERFKNIKVWNQPVYFPLIFIGLLILAFIAPIMIAFRLRERGAL